MIDEAIATLVREYEGVASSDIVFQRLLPNATRKIRESTNF